MEAPRPRARTRRAAASFMLVVACLVGMAGCDPRTLLFFLQPYDPVIEPTGPSLKGKKVVVITHATSSALGEFQTLERDITREIVSILREKVKKLEIVEADKVNKWAEDHPNWTDQAEVAKAFEADMVIFLEIEAFQLQHPNDLNVFQGLSKTHVLVTAMEHPKNSRGKPITDQPKEANTVFDEYRDTEFPIRGPIPIDSGVSRGAFKSRFLKVVANEISWFFVEHAPGDDIQDVRFNSR